MKETNSTTLAMIEILPKTIQININNNQDFNKVILKNNKKNKNVAKLLKPSILNKKYTAKIK